MRIRKTVFGRSIIKSNTFIGGVSSTLNTPALIAGKLGITTSRIKSFKVIGNDIEFHISGGSYIVQPSCFFNNTDITYFHDSDGNVTSVGYASFSGCRNITSVIMPNLQSAEGSGYASSGAFCGCVNLVLFSAPKLVSVGSYVFQSCSMISNFDFPLLTEIRGAAFSGCSNLETITTGNVSVLAGGSFRLCEKLTSFNCNYIKIVEPNCFEKCSSLVSIVGLSNATSIGSNAFSECVSLGGAIAMPLVTSIGYQAFRNCYKITDYDMPELLTLKEASSITHTFSNGLSVNTIYMPKIITLGTVGNNNIFSGIKKGCTITVPIAMKTINLGNPDGDLVYVSTSQAASIIYV